MKKSIILIAFIGLLSCKTNKKTTDIVQPITKIDMKYISLNTDDCQENASCVFEIIPNKTIVFKKDKIGMNYPIISDGNKILVKYTFNKNKEKGLQDGSYTEIVYAELDKIENTTLIDSNLKSVKLYFGRLCYCKGETGYFPITKGSFSIAQLNEKEFNFDISFSVSEVPQIISEVNQTISIK